MKTIVIDINDLGSHGKIVNEEKDGITFIISMTKSCVYLLEYEDNVSIYKFAGKGITRDKGSSTPLRDKFSLGEMLPENLYLFQGMFMAVDTELKQYAILLETGEEYITDFDIDVKMHQMNTNGLSYFEILCCLGL